MEIREAGGTVNGFGAPSHILIALLILTSSEFDYSGICSAPIAVL